MFTLLGIDLAWGDNNPSAISVAQIIDNNHIRINEIHTNIFNWHDIIENRIITKSTIGIAIDAPLIINNIDGMRLCDRELSSEYGGRGASCHAANLTLYPDHPGVRLSKELIRYGFEHLNCKGNYQIECYPHPALIEILGLDYRLKYKRGPVSEKRDGQCILSDRIRQLEKSSVLKLTFAKETMSLQYDYIKSLSGKKLKQNEDVLNSMICAYIAALFYFAFHYKNIGTLTDGYIYVPKVKCI